MTTGKSCKKKVFTGARWDIGGHQCGRPAQSNGLCAIHQPEAIERKQAKRAAQYEADREARYQRELAASRDLVLKFLEHTHADAELKEEARKWESHQRWWV